MKQEVRPMEDEGELRSLKYRFFQYEGELRSLKYRFFQYVGELRVSGND